MRNTGRTVVSAVVVGILATAISVALPPPTAATITPHGVALIRPVAVPPTILNLLAPESHTTQPSIDAVATEPPTPVPPPITYSVRRGDTLSAIAGQCGASTGDVAAMNDIPDPNVLSVDQILFVPCEIVWPVIPIPVVVESPAMFVPANGAPSGNADLDAVVAFALAQVGKWYSWGGNGPDTWDCSGLMVGAYGSIGIALPRTTYTQAVIGRYVSLGEVQPGDLIIFGASQGHVGMAISATEVVHAPQSGEQVKVTAISYMGEISTIRRVVG